MIDVHQHVWPAELIESLRRRTAPPRLDGWTLHLDGEPPYEVDPVDHDPDARVRLARGEGLSEALVSLSSPLGIEALPADEASELIAAYHDGALALPAPLAAWAAAPVTGPADPAELERQLDRGFAGLQLPATALASAAGYERNGPLLELLARRGLPLFVHPGPTAATGPDAATRAPWWPPVVDYVSQMHAAWFAFRVHGRPAHPALKVCFAMLAGLAPLHGERFVARAHERTVVDENAFLETSSYGPRAIDAIVRVTGIDVLVNGSDRPYAQPPQSGLGAAADAALTDANPRRLLDPQEVTE